MWPRLILVLLAFVVLAAPIHAQQQQQHEDEGGRGVIRQGTTTPIEELTTLNPLFCASLLCIEVTDLLYSRLLHVDPASNEFAPAGTGDEALVTGWQISDEGTTYTLTIRDDLTWSDGEPVTAYDALFSVYTVWQGDISTRYDSSALRDDVVGLAAPDERTLVVTFEQPTCRGLHRMNFPVIPAHIYDPAFPAGFDLDYSLAGISRSPRNIVDPVTAGKYLLDEIRAPEYVRLISEDGQQGYEFVYESAYENIVTGFLRGEYTVQTQPFGFNNGDVQAIDGQIAGGTLPTVFMLGFNLADPTEPRAWDTDDDNGQGSHPVFGDIRVRQAVQLGLNVDDLVTQGFNGQAIPLTTLALPAAWYANPDLTAPPYDYDEARRLLDDAGWRDTDGDGVRECRACETAPIGTLLAVNWLNSFGSNTPDGFNITRQLRRLGFQVNNNSLEAESQQFDLWYGPQILGRPYNPADAFAIFETQNDVPGIGANITSYSNPRVDDLLQQAATQSCMDRDARAAAYREVQATVAEELPYIPLVAPQRQFFAGAGVANFDPFPTDPLWNVESWIITDPEVTR
jgi:peptide/nickel transport system substrate-binding protein